MKKLLFISSLLLIISSCSKLDEEAEDNHNEVVTTVELHFKQISNGAETVFKWEDLDGDGGNNPVIENITLLSNQSYNVELVLLDKTKTPVDTISLEVKEEDDEHRFYYIQNAGNITVSDYDKDVNGVDVGLHTQWTTSAAGNSIMNVVLRHYAEGGKLQSDLVNDTKSSTDMDISFNVSVQ